MKPFLVKKTKNLARRPMRLNKVDKEEIKKEIAVRTIGYKVVTMYGQKVAVQVLAPWCRLETVLPETKATVDGLEIV